MISINGVTDKYILDLNEYPNEHNELVIDSNYNGFPSTWAIDYVSSLVMNTYKTNDSTLNIDLSLSELKEDGIIIIRNIREEYIIIVVKPNIEGIREKNYKFKLGKSTISGNSITFNVISSENGSYEPWSVEYDGAPLSYAIDKKKTKITFTLESKLLIEYISTIILNQDNSGEKIKIKLKHSDSDSVELYETEKTD